MPDLSTIRLREDAPNVRWLLFVDGIPIAWTNDNGQGWSGTIIGTGPSTWIGDSEVAIDEDGGRSVVSGLQMPSALVEAIDVRASDIEPNPTTFRLHDDDTGTLADLFAREGKPFDILRERLAPGTAVMPATALGQGAGLIDIWDRNVGIERVGPAGERRQFPALPDELVGFDHAVQQDLPGPEGLAPIKVSDEPLQWTGRLVTLWAIYRDPDDPTDDYTAWPTWDLQAAAGPPQFVGKVIAFRRQQARVWELQCHGIDGLYRKQLGRVTSGVHQPISTELQFGDGEDDILVYFTAVRGAGDVGEPFNSLTFGGVTLTGSTKAELVDEINDAIQDVVDDTFTNWAQGGGVLEDWDEAGVDQDPEAGCQFGAQTAFYVRKAVSVSQEHFLSMYVILHARVWRQLGYEPETQHTEISQGTSDTREIRFRRVLAGDDYRFSGGIVPTDNYWEGWFTTVGVGFTHDLVDVIGFDNSGNRRRWHAKYIGEPFTISMNPSDQLVRLGGGSSPYIEGQLTIPVSGDDVDGVPTEYARYWAFRGKVSVLAEGAGGFVEPSEPEDTVQVAEMEWADDNYGTVSPGTGSQPAAILKRWLDPRVFGFPFRRLEGLEYWTGVTGGEGQIDAAPMSAYAYLGADKPEYASDIWGQVLLSTGSGGGITGGIIDPGDNSPGALPGSLVWANDVELADMGCAVPYQLVAPLADVRAVFDQLPGGFDGSMQRVRHAYIGPYLAQDVLSSIMRPRRLAWSFHGGVLGVVRFAPFSPLEADIIVGEADLYGDDDPRSDIPKQGPTPVGQLDGVALMYRWRPDEAKNIMDFEFLSRDAESASRTGELVEAMEDRGLLDPVVAVEVGVGAWNGAFEQFWAKEAAAFFSLDHYMLRMTVSRPKGQDIRIGTKLLVTNPWPANNAGGYGLTDHTGIVVRREYHPETHAVAIDLFVFAGQGEGWRFFGPGPRVLDQAGAVLTVSTDQYGHGDNVEDGDGLEAPSFTSASVGRDIQIVYRIGEDWALGTVHTVNAWDAGTATLTLATAPTTDFEYTDRWVIMADYDTQGAGTYPRAVFGPIVEDDYTFGVGPTSGSPFVPD